MVGVGGCTFLRCMVRLSGINGITGYNLDWRGGQ